APVRGRPRGLPSVPAPVGAPPPSPGGLRAPWQPCLLPAGRRPHRRAAGGGPGPAAVDAQRRHRAAERGAGAARDPGDAPMSPSPHSAASSASSEPETLATRIRGALSRSRSLWPSTSDYRFLRKTWRKDLLAGVTVGIVALPLALGFGVSSGLTAEQGLVTAIVAGLLAAIFGGSNVQVSGPTGAMVVVLVPIVATYGVGAIAAVTLLAGLIVLVTGLLKLGRVVSIIPWPVIEGFTLGIACIIFMQQVPLVTSPVQAAPGELSSNALVAAVQSLLAADPVYLAWALGAAAVVAACMLVAPRIHPSIPGSLIGIGVVSVLAVITPAPLATIGAIPASLPAPSLPTIDPGLITVLLPGADGGGARGDRVAAVGPRGRDHGRHRCLRSRSGAGRPGRRLDRRLPVRGHAGHRCDRPHLGQPPGRGPHPHGLDRPRPGAAGGGV